MATFPRVNPGDRYQPSATFHNAVVDMVNKTNVPSRATTKGSSSRRSISVPCACATSAIKWGKPIEFVGFTMDDDNIPENVMMAKPNTSAVFHGIAKEDADVGVVFNATVAGIAKVRIADGGEEFGAFVSVDTENPSQFIRAGAGMPIVGGVQTSTIGGGPVKWAYVLCGSGNASSGEASYAFDGFAVPSDSSDSGSVSASSETYSVRMHGGTATSMFGTTQVFDAATFSDVPEGEIFWLAYDPDEEEERGGGGEPWSIGHGQTLPSQNITIDGVRYYTPIPLFRVVGGICRNVEQYHDGSVFVPTVVNHVSVQEV